MPEPISPYGALIEEIIRKQSSILGLTVAIRRARNVQGLEVEDTGAVKAIAGDPMVAIEQLAGQYKALSGSIGIDFCRSAAATWRTAHADLPLPAILL